LKKTRISRRYIKMPIIDILANVTKIIIIKVIKRLIKGKNGHNRYKKNDIGL